MLNLKKLEYALTKDSLCDAERVSEALAIVRDARRSSPSQVAPANPAQVTDAMVTKALSAFEKDHPHNRAAMRAEAEFLRAFYHCERLKEMAA